MFNANLPFASMDDADFRVLFMQDSISFDLDNMVFDPIRGHNLPSFAGEEDDIDAFLTNQGRITIPESKYISEINEISVTGSSLSCMFLNIRSVPHNFNLFKATYGNCADILGLAETRLNTDVTQLYQDNLPGYTLFSQARNRNGGGVAMYIRQTFDATRLIELDITEDHIECIACTVAVGQATWFVAVIYRPPSGNFQLFLESLEKILKSARDKNLNKLLLTGDFNVNLLKNDAQSQQLINLMSSYYCYCSITKPTRVVANSATLIDHIWSSVSDRNFSNYIIQDDISDHYLVFSQHYIHNNHNRSDILQKIRIFDEGSKRNFMQLLTEVQWDDVMAMQNVNQAYDLFFERLMHCYEQSFVIKEIKFKTKTSCPWMTPAIKDNLREKRRLHRLAKKWPMTYMDQYCTHRDYCNQLIKTVSNDYYRNELESCKGNIRKTWKTINSVLGRSNQTKNNIKNANVDISVENYINQYFINSINEIKENLPETDDDAFMHYMGESSTFSMRVNP